jgi:hypothetical protein
LRLGVARPIQPDCHRRADLIEQTNPAPCWLSSFD